MGWVVCGVDLEINARRTLFKYFSSSFALCCLLVRVFVLSYFLFSLLFILSVLSVIIMYSIILLLMFFVVSALHHISTCYFSNFSLLSSASCTHLSSHLPCLLPCTIFQRTKAIRKKIPIFFFFPKFKRKTEDTLRHVWKRSLLESGLVWPSKV